MKPNETNKPSKYACNICNFNSNNKNDYSRHLLTAKHVNKTNMKHQNSFLPHEENTKYKCQLCSSNFASRTTLWRHKQKCVKEELPDNKDILLDYLIKQNSELQKQILDMCKNNTNQIL